MQQKGRLKLELIPPWPTSPGAWMAAISAAMAACVGLVLALQPVLHFRRGSGAVAPELACALGGGFCLGLGLAAILLDQPLIHLSLGACWALAATSALLGVMAGAWRSFGHWLLALAGASLAAMPLAYVLGYLD